MDCLRLDSVLSLTEEEAAGAVRGVSIRKVSDSRSCLTFNHPEDLRRILELRPWIFYKNLIVLQPIPPKENPLLIRWLEILRGFDTIRIRINLNVTRPQKWALKLYSEEGAELIVKNTPYGAWLRAIGLNKWLTSTSDLIRPTYVWRSSRPGSGAAGSRRGPGNFGDFGHMHGDACVPPPAAVPVLSISVEDQERLIRPRVGSSRRDNLLYSDEAVLVTTASPDRLSVSAEGGVAHLELIDVPLVDQIRDSCKGAEFNVPCLVLVCRAVSAVEAEAAEMAADVVLVCVGMLVEA
ncbi:hypothetical protein Salat_1665200 [Sesamum alatum]|uniref:DUF4283 domain-containing protein n=1 Tax=Sesamum alatum TaxID=300844 RepID=A0AAE2CJR2_9LAMI|nr:hypothetical protein Salat_1665200 [Sesamum alatum]